MGMNRLAMKNSFRKWVVLLLTLSVYACSSSAPQGQSSQTAATDLPFANDIADESVMGKWARSCALCHVTGEAGAPIAGDSVEWQQRLVQGEESILQRVLEGYNSMPPLGYCMSCEVKDFRAMIGFMTGSNQ
jgi:cytochrome c5|tara:strand:- start:117 stop:512 length:396 start_codon:yes stop_codon:yes gene_type:complete